MKWELDIKCKFTNPKNKKGQECLLQWFAFAIWWFKCNRSNWCHIYLFTDFECCTIVWIKRQVVELCCFFFQRYRWSRMIDWTDFLSQNWRLQSLLSCIGSMNKALLWSCNFNVCLVQRSQVDQHQELALRSWDCLGEPTWLNPLSFYAFRGFDIGQDKNHRISGVG